MKFKCFLLTRNFVLHLLSLFQTTSGVCAGGADDDDVDVDISILQGPPPQGPLKFTIVDTLERIKEEFNFLQAQYHT